MSISLKMEEFMKIVENMKLMGENEFQEKK